MAHFLKKKNKLTYRFVNNVRSVYSILSGCDTIVVPLMNLFYSAAPYESCCCRSGQPSWTRISSASSSTTATRS